MADLYLGIDGGQSSTTALIADGSGRIVGRGTGGPCNHVKGAEARTKFLNAIGDCLLQACAQAHVPADGVAFSAACLGFSGGYEDKESYSRELIRSAKWKITHDAEIALAGATAGQPGVMVIAGTGSMAFGKNAAGEMARAGGWGYIFGDEGGALYLVRQGLRAALQHEEGWGQPTALTSLFLERLGASRINDVLHHFYVTPRSEIASYAQLLNQAADGGDDTAIKIFADAGARLAWYVKGVYQHIFRQGDGFLVSYVGGTFRSPFLVSNYARCIKESLGADVTAPIASPAAGALIEAFKLTGIFSEQLVFALQYPGLEIK